MAPDVFCKIVKGDIKTNFLYKDKDFVVIKDISPAAPVHILLIPRVHFKDLGAFKSSHALMLGKAMLLIEKISKKVGLKNGYRVIINKGKDAEGGVPHFHIHVLGGKKLGSKIIK